MTMFTKPNIWIGWKLRVNKKSQMLYISHITKYPYLLATEVLPLQSKEGNALQMDFMQGYSAMFFGKIPYSAIGKKYAIVSDSSTKRQLSIDEWTPEMKTYFETRKHLYKLPFRYRFGWVYVWLGALLFVILLFAGLIAYLLFITKK